jgi:hypothetical protein
MDWMMKRKYKHLSTMAQKISTSTGKKVTIEDLGLLFKNIVFSFCAKYTYYTSTVLKDRELGMNMEIRKNIFNSIINLFLKPSFSPKVYNSDTSLVSFISREIDLEQYGVFADFIVEAARDIFVYLIVSAPAEMLDLKEYREFIVDVLIDYLDVVKTYHVTKPINREKIGLS